jgi:hypothetical protein
MSSDPIDVDEAEKIPSAVPEPPKKKKRGMPKGGWPKKEGIEAKDAKPKKAEAARMPVPPVWNRIIADLPYAAVPIIQARTGLPIAAELPMVDNASVTIDRESVRQMYESGREAFDQWMLSFGGLKVHPALAYFGSVLATIGMAGYVSYLKVQEQALQLRIMQMNQQRPTTKPGQDNPPETVVNFGGVHVPAPVELDADGMPPAVTAA